jgi:hypothetical protein
MESCLLKFTLTETTGIINTGYFKNACMGELYSNSDGMHDVFSFNMGKYNALQFISMDALFNPYDLLNTEYYDQFAG